MLRRKSALKHKSSSRSHVSARHSPQVKSNPLAALSTTAISGNQSHSTGVHRPGEFSRQTTSISKPHKSHKTALSRRSFSTENKETQQDAIPHPSVIISARVQKPRPEVNVYHSVISPTESLPEQPPTFKSRLPKHAPIESLDEEGRRLLAERKRRVELSSSTPRPMYSNGEPIPIYIPKPPPLLSPAELQLFKLKQAELIRQFQVINPRYVSPDPYTFEQEAKVANLFPVIRAYNRFPTINQVRHPDYKKFVWWWWWPEHHHAWLQYLEDYENLKQRPTIPFRLGQFAADLVNFSRDFAVRFRSFTWEFIRLFSESGRLTSVLKNVWRALKHELKHYGHGFSRLFKNTSVAIGYAFRRLRGQVLSRRERRHLIRTMADLMRLVPFVIIVAIPFLEFALPVLLKLFPNMLPSTFKDQEQEKDKQRQELRLRLELAEFLQDSVGQLTLETLGRRKDFYEREMDRMKEDIDHSDVDDHIELHSMAAAADIENEDYIRKVDESGEVKNPATYLNNVFERIVKGLSVDNHDVTEVINMFKSQITLETMRRQELVALCRYMKLSIYGTDNQLRTRLRQHLTDIRDDDILIEKEGVDTLNYEELVEACRDRGMRVQTDEKSPYYTDEPTLKRQLESWIHLNVHLRLPTTLLILSRAVNILERKQENERESGEVIRIDNDIASVDPELREALDDRLDVLSKLSRVLDEQAEYEDLAKQEEKEKEEYERRLKEYQTVRKEREQQHTEMLSKVGLTVEALAQFGLTTLHPPEETRKALAERYGPDFMSGKIRQEQKSQDEDVLEQLTHLIDDDDKSMLRRIKTLRDEQSDHEELLEDVGIMSEEDELSEGERARRAENADHGEEAKAAAAAAKAKAKEEQDIDAKAPTDDVPEEKEQSEAEPLKVQSKAPSDTEKPVAPVPPVAAPEDDTTKVTPPEVAVEEQLPTTPTPSTDDAVKAPSATKKPTTTEAVTPEGELEEATDLSSSEAIHHAIIRLLSDDEREASGAASDVSRSKHMREIFGSETEASGTEASSSEDVLTLKFDDEDDILREDESDQTSSESESSTTKKVKSDGEKHIKPVDDLHGEIASLAEGFKHPPTPDELIQDIVDHMPVADSKDKQVIDDIIFAAPVSAAPSKTHTKKHIVSDTKPVADVGVTPPPETPQEPRAPSSSLDDKVEPTPAKKPVSAQEQQKEQEQQQASPDPDTIIEQMMTPRPIVEGVIRTPEQQAAIRLATERQRAKREMDLDSDDSDTTSAELAAALSPVKGGRYIGDEFVFLRHQGDVIRIVEQDEDVEAGDDDDEEEEDASAKFEDDQDHAETIVTATSLVSKMLDQLEHDIAEDIAEEAVQKRDTPQQPDGTTDAALDAAVATTDAAPDAAAQPTTKAETTTSEQPETIQEQPKNEEKKD